MSKGLLKIRLNQDQSCFSCGLENGVAIYSVNPLARLSSIDFNTIGGISHVEMLGHCNVLVLVGGGQSPKYSDRHVLIWDDKEQCIVYELAFGFPVLSVRIKKDRLAVIGFSEIHIFTFPSVELLSTFKTSPNPRGLCELCDSCHLMVYPGHQRGTIQIVNMDGSNKTDSVCQVHQHDLSCMALDQQGYIVATASSKGTLIRVHSTVSRQLLAEFRRGADPANIYCLAFSLDSLFLCVSSDKGTVHVFAVEDQTLNKKSSLANVGLTQVFSKTVGTTYIESQWNLAQFMMPSEVPCVCGFLPDRKAVIAVCMDGTFHQYTFTLDGQCYRDSYDIFMDMKDEEI